ncbi:MAG: hypothetical protein JJT94_01975 [Bernardetiaceae bacterium]|nr:hypothetical protein [Bernardetiaceae bacterium]
MLYDIEHSSPYYHPCFMTLCYTRSMLFYGFIALLFVGLITACNPDKEKKINPEDVRFRSTYQSRLFFKNTRSLSYNVEELSQLKWEIFRYQDRSLDSTKAIINLAIVNDWKEERAYIIVEPNDFIKNKADKLELKNLEILWKDNTLGIQGRIPYPMRAPKEEQFEFAARVYNLIVEGRELYICIGETEYPFLHQKNEAEAFRITLMDFYRLVMIFK